MGQMPLLTKHAGYRQVAFEISPQICAYGRETFDIDMVPGTIDDRDGMYDGILFMDLIEHILDPVSFLRSVARHCHDQTVLLLQTPRYNPDLDYEQMRRQGPRFEALLEPNEHIYLFSRQSIQTILKKCGFPNIQFEPAFFGDDYDLFLAASQTELSTYSQEKIADTLTQPSSVWMIRAALKMDQDAKELISVAHQALHDAGLREKESQAAIQALQAAIQSLQAALNDANLRKQALQSDLLAMDSSLSWRITKPLRMISQALRRKEH
jgi:hypothetical protein